ncbi:zinc finger protein RFP-like isoform X5 [Accipiter gentilis]|uniref:zinc finger protein RFP-like isoform X5 n=1 Tax=Astur gentilis TaxID=8957 RepID=UPI002110E329|nr:zinc finger protein RFP-like isoform X5 [Accipiter gentilis]
MRVDLSVPLSRGGGGLPPPTSPSSDSSGPGSANGVFARITDARFWMPTAASCPVAVSRKTIARPLRVGVSLSVHKKQPRRFSHGCGTRRGKSSGGNHLRHAAGAGSCPQCRLPFPRDGFRPNRQLANVVAAVRELAMPAAEELCRRHCQPFTLFCRRNGILLCAACAENRAHRAVPLAEAAREYRERFETSLKALQEEDERRARLAAAAEETRQEMLSRADAEKQKLLAVLEGLRRVLGEQESRFLIRLGRLRRGLEEQRRGETTELARLRQRRTELQTKCRQTDSDLLRDAQITLSRCTEWRAQPSLPPMPDLEAEFEDFALKTNMLAEAVTQFKDILGCSLEEDLGGYRRATVTLDPATAHPQILLSADGRTAGRRESPPAPLPSGAERFESLRCVLGQQGFTGGRHRWAVEITQAGSSLWFCNCCQDVSRERGHRWDFIPHFNTYE